MKDHFGWGTLRETLTKGTEGLPKDIYSLINHYTDAKDIWDNVKMLLEGSELTKEDRESQLNQATIQDGKVVVQNVHGRQNRGQGNNTRGAGATSYGGAQNRVGYANPGQARPIKCYNYNGIGHLAKNCTQPKRPQNLEYFKDKMLLMQAQKNGVALNEEQLLFIAGGQDNAVDEDADEQPVQDLVLNVDNMFQADDCNAFDSDVDEALTAQTMFMENLSFEKTCKTRITPTGLTEWERGFEQKKKCYLTEVIPFFKTLKEHFEGIQKALTKEIKEMEALFDELEAEVDQNVVNRKCDEIEQKNLHITNDTLIEKCLSKEVFYIETNYELNVSRFSEMHDAHTVVQARCLELETELSKLKDKIQKEDHDVMVKHFTNLEESVATIREIVEEARVERPLDSSLASACLYTKRSQELVEYAVGTCPKDFNKRDKKQATTPLNRKKQVTFADECEHQIITHTNM
nr:hypothetical protein [Tanacetum cinerariifolium]GEX82596.1 hypothetical protein [Tanacetum cinerariifolium]